MKRRESKTWRRIQPGSADGTWCVSVVTGGKVVAQADNLSRDLADQYMALRTNKTLALRLNNRSHR